MPLNTSISSEVKVKTKNILTLSFIQVIVLGMGRAVVALIPILAENFNVNLDIIGLTLSIGALGTLFAQLFSGIIAEKFGEKNVFVLGSILFIIGYSSIFFSSSFLYFSISYIISSIAWGIILTNAFSLVSSNYKLDVTRVIIKLDMGFMLGVASSPLLLSGILYLGISWRYIFLCLALIEFVLLIFMLSFKIDGFDNKKNKKILLKLFLVNRKLLVNKVVVLCGVIALLHYGAAYTFGTWFTTYFGSLNVTLIISSLLLGLYNLVFCFGSYIKSILVIKFNEKKIMLFFTVLALIFLFISFFANWLLLKIILIILFSFSIASIAEISMAIGIKQNPRYSRSLTGIMTSYARVGAVIFQYTTGYFTQYYSGNSVIYICLIVLFLSMIFIGFLNFRLA